ncbi:MAG: ribosome recycling factor [Acidobacteriota bacterium]
MSDETRKVTEDMARRMSQAIDHLKHELASIRTGRASLAILDGIRVTYFDNPSPLNQVAKLSIPEASLIVIQPYDISLIVDIEKAIRSADLGLNPSNDGKLIRVPIPPLTAERRETLMRKVHSLGEEAKTAIRQVRRDGNDAIKKLEKTKVISQDEMHRTFEAIQKATDKECQVIDAAVSQKDRELTEV